MLQWAELVVGLTLRLRLPRPAAVLIPMPRMLTSAVQGATRSNGEMHGASMDDHNIRKAKPSHGILDYVGENFLINSIQMLSAAQHRAVQSDARRAQILRPQRQSLPPHTQTHTHTHDTTTEDTNP